MSVAELLILSIALGMDAFAVSICKGLAMSKMSWKKAGIIGLYFGGFQALMPCIGYGLGMGLEDKIKSIDHWIAFVLLGWIGIHMIKEAMQKEQEESNDNIGVKTMLVLAIATSIDALAVGVTFAFLGVNLLAAVIAIGVVTFFLSIWGVKIGNVFGDKYKRKAEIIGGIILIGIGIKILLEHCFFS